MSRQPAVTPRSVQGLAPAGFWPRAGAAFLDLAVGAAWAIPFRQAWRAALADPLALGPFRASGLAVVGLFWVYLVVTTATTGGTLGKHAFRLRVVTTGYARPDWLTVAFREVVGRILVTGTLFLGYLWVAVDPRKQGWHDRIADTLVVKRVSALSVADPWTRSRGKHRSLTVSERPERAPASQERLT